MHYRRMCIFFGGIKTYCSQQLLLCLQDLPVNFSFHVSTDVVFGIKISTPWISWWGSALFYHYYFHCLKFHLFLCRYHILPHCKGRLLGEIFGGRRLSFRMVKVFFKAMPFGITSDLWKVPQSIFSCQIRSPNYQY